MARAVLQGSGLMWLCALPALGMPNDELVRVAHDRWGFETSISRTPFIPFGVNFVLNDKRYLNVFGPGVYDKGRYERALAALERLGFNTVKVFLPIGEVLQPTRRARTGARRSMMTAAQRPGVYAPRS